jgi:hypothetical protein
MKNYVAPVAVVVEFEEKDLLTLSTTDKSETPTKPW